MILSGWAENQHGSAEITIPDYGGTATFVQPLSPSLESKIGLIGDDHGIGRNIGGQLVYKDRLYISAFVYYDSPPSAKASLFSRPLDLHRTGDVAGPATVGDMDPGFTSGYMATVPGAWQAALGGSAVIGNCCLSIISRTSFGPALFAFNPEQPKTARPLVYYDESHQTLGRYGDAQVRPIFNGTTRITGVALPEETASALFFGSTGTGKWCYGTGSDCADPMDRESKGDHAFPYRAYVWAYDLAALASVRSGAKRPWDVKPYATWELDWNGVWNNFGSGGAAYDPETQRIFVLQVGGAPGGPLIHVYHLALAVHSANP